MLFRKTPVRGNFMDKKGGGREFHDFPSKFVCLTIPKRFAGEPFCVLEKCISKISRQKRWILLFLVRNRLSHSTDELLIGARPRFRSFWLSK